MIVLCPTVQAFATCEPPHYRKGRVWEDTTSYLNIAVSIRLEDFAPARLICLARALRQRYPERDLLVSIFSSREAALGWLPLTERTPNLWEYESKLHGFYSYVKAKHQDYLLVLPDGHSQDVHSALTTRIDLPTTVAPVCRLAVDSRCLLEFQHMVYPGSAEGQRAVGRITIAGTIERDGVVSNLSVVEASITPAERQPMLVSSAMQNLGTWRFEPGYHPDGIRITYSFDRVDSPSVGDASGLQFRLPFETRAEAGRSR